MATGEAPAPADAPGPAVSDSDLTAAAPDVLADSLSDYLRAWGRRIKGGESGALPVLVGLIAIVIFFQAERSQFLHAQNLVNLLVESSIYIMFGAAEIFVLLLSEIDLSIGFGAACGAFIMCELIAPPVNLPWWLGILCGLGAMAVIGFVQGSLISRLGLPSFIVTLGGYLGLTGVMLEIANADKTAVGGVINIDPNSPVAKLTTGHISTTLGWVLMIAVVAVFAVASLYRDRSRRRQGLTTPPIGVTIMTIALAAVAGIVLVLICNSNQGLQNTPIRGMPWVIPFVLLVLFLYSFLLGRTRIGRYVYAVGNNPEAARRAGIKVKWVITFGFIMSSVTAGFAGLIYASQQGSMATDIDGGSYVLYGVAAAVIGGTSLFGGRGKIFNALLGGIVVGTIYDGLGLMAVSSAVEYMVTAVVLIAAVTLDAIVRRRAVAR